MKMVRLSALSIDHLNPQEILLVLISVRGCRAQNQSAAGRIKSMKNSNDNLKNQTYVLPACNAVPRANKPLCGPEQSVQHTSRSFKRASDPYPHCKAASKLTYLIG